MAHLGIFFVGGKRLFKFFLSLIALLVGIKFGQGYVCDEGSILISMVSYHYSFSSTCYEALRELVSSRVVLFARF